MEEQKKKEQKSEDKNILKKQKNLISAVILLTGLLMGSLFVDVVQLFQGSGFSKKNLNKTDVFEADGKTWVAFEEPGVEVMVLSDDECLECDPGEALVWMRRVMPTISAEKVNFDSEKGKMLQEKYSLKSLPAFIFDENITKTNFYLQAQILFEEREGGYVFNTQELGLAPGKFLTTPEIREGDAIFGNKDSENKVVIFSDFQCPYSKIFHTALQKNTKEFGDRVEFAFKHLPLSFHEQAGNAALASECANEQGKFWEYADRLFSKQNEWGAKEGTSIFKTYASSLALDRNKFNSCLDDMKYQGKIEADMKEASSFGISGTPAIFVGKQFQNGAMNEAQLKDLINDEINK